MYSVIMTGRSPDDFNHERQSLDAAHAQNEAGRDAFVALAHTALFAASVSFVGDVAPLAQAVWKPVLILGWLADVIGLLALTVSFGAARKAIDARCAALNDPEPPDSWTAEVLNGIALWSFPVALLCLFSFVTANVVSADDRQIRSPDTALNAELRAPGRVATPAITEPQRRPAEPLDRRNTGASDASPGRAAAPAAVEEVKGSARNPTG